MTTTHDLQLTHFRLDVDEGLATVTIDKQGETLNTLDPSLMEDFTTLLDRLESDPDIRAVVLVSAKEDGFVAGANLRWIAELTDAAAASEAIGQGRVIYDRLEALHTQRAKPVVAAIHGACLGGGMELALACSHRIVTDHPKTQLGQPEVQLGLIPAGGGTQRLPELIGVVPALDLLLTGKSVRPKKALRLGLADEVVPATILVGIARDRARAAIGAAPADDGGLRQWLSGSGLQKLALETNPVGLAILFRQARQKMLSQTRKLPGSTQDPRGGPDRSAGGSRCRPGSRSPFLR